MRKGLHLGPDPFDWRFGAAAVMALYLMFSATPAHAGSMGQTMCDWTHLDIFCGGGVSSPAKPKLAPKPAPCPPPPGTQPPKRGPMVPAA